MRNWCNTLSVIENAALSAVPANFAPDITGGADENTRRKGLRIRRVRNARTTTVAIASAASAQARVQSLRREFGIAMERCPLAAVCPGPVAFVCSLRAFFF